MIVESGRGGGIPTAREGEEACRERVRCLEGERDIEVISDYSRRVILYVTRRDTETSREKTKR